jgi:monoamine oxidase
MPEVAVAKNARQESQRADADIAIVGAGVAGLYVASRLLSEPAYKAKSIALFDAANRVGGRILSISVPGIPYIAELGAMRYLPEQILTRSIIQNRLQLEHSDFTFETEGYFLRGKYISQKAFTAAKATRPPRNVFPYDVDETEIGKSPIDLIVLSIHRALRELELLDMEYRGEARGFSILALQQKLRNLNEKTHRSNLITHFTTKEWRLIKRYGRINGRALYEIAFWDLIRQFLSREAYNLVYDGSGGYQHLNAADAIVWFLSDFAGSPYRTVVGGMGRLVEKLREEIDNRANFPPNDRLQLFNLGWNLREVRHQAGGKNGFIQLTFAVNETVGGAVPTAIKTISAATVVLALPQPALKIINFFDFQIERGDSSKRAADRFNTMLNAVSANPLFKACVLYDKPWWGEDKKSSCFRIFTDLPLRQIYYFGSAKCQVSTNGDRRLTCMVLLFVDARYAQYWKRLDEMNKAGQKYYSSVLEKSMNEPSRTEFHRVVGVYGTGNIVATRVEDLLAKVAGKGAPRPDVLVLKHWHDWPYHAGWHAWTAGARSWEVSEKLVRPFLDADLFICGEAFSGEQGWIEGALKSAERVLERMGLASPPSWVNKAEYEEQKELWT